MKIDTGSILHRRGVRLLILCLLLAVMVRLEIASMLQESVTFDEPAHLVGGYVSWKFDDYRLQMSHGMLPERWFALPLLSSNLQFPNRISPEWRKPGLLGNRPCREFLFFLGNDTDDLIFQGRLMAVAISILVVVAIYAWTSRLFGPEAGLIASYFCALSPTVLGHGHLMTSDLTAALLFLISAGCFWMLLQRLTWWRLGASAVCFGLLMVSKMSGGLLVPVALLMFVVRMVLRRSWPVELAGFPRRSVARPVHQILSAGGVALTHALVGLAIIWTFYGWQNKPAVDWNPAMDDYTEPKTSIFSGLGPVGSGLIALDRSQILPDAYVYGLAHTIKNAAWRPAFLNGNYSPTGWWYYFPYCFFVKSSPAFLALLLLGVILLALWALSRHSRPRCLVWVNRSAPLWSILLVYGVAAMTTNLNIGVRHILPLYLPLLIFAGATGAWLWRRNPGGRITLACLMAAQIAAVAGIHPHYLSYFNFFAGGPEHGYLHLTDSNVDWGQDLPALARWLEHHRTEIGDDDVYLSYFGLDEPGRFGIKAQPLPSWTNPRISAADPIAYHAGIYCLSASRLIGLGYGRASWNEETEREYVGLLAYLRYLENTDPPDQHNPASVTKWVSLFRTISDFQFRRLSSRLMERRPDAMAGYSILIYRLSETELHRALLPGGQPQTGQAEK